MLGSAFIEGIEEMHLINFKELTGQELCALVDLGIEVKPRVAPQVRDVIHGARDKIVDGDDFVSARQQQIDEV